MDRACMGGGAFATCRYGKSPVITAARTQAAQFSGAELFLGRFFFRQQAKDLRQVCRLCDLTAYTMWV